MSNSMQKKKYKEGLFWSDSRRPNLCNNKEEKHFTYSTSISSNVLHLRKRERFTSAKINFHNPKAKKTIEERTVHIDEGMFSIEMQTSKQVNNWFLRCKARWTPLHL